MSDDPAQFCNDALGYARRIADAPALASEHARLAAQRFINDLEKAGRHEIPWVFDAMLARRAMLFAAQMPNIKGPDAGKPIRLMDWQKFVFANVFGWVDPETRGRRFRQAAIFVPKGNGKTTISAPLAMYLTFGEGEGGAEGYAAAVTRDQAKILFTVAKEMVKRSPEMRREWGVGVLTNAIFQDRTASSFVPISSDAKALDGLNVQSRFATRSDHTERARFMMRSIPPLARGNSRSFSRSRPQPGTSRASASNSGTTGCGFCNRVRRMIGSLRPSIRSTTATTLGPRRPG